MATFAHLVGFNQDYKTVMHMHPKGPPVLDPAARADQWSFRSPRCGPVRSSLRTGPIEGRSRFAPFGLQIVP